MAAGLTDAELAKELRNDQSALRPEAWRALEEEARRRAKPRRSPILTTAPSLNRPIRRVLGVVGSEYVMGVNLFQEFLAGIRDTVGGRSTTIQAALREGREALLRELSASAAHLHADAVVSITFT
ncbi:MAG: heavy metal-binding domain-containing protein, partial [Gemmatimonadota bacterium]|nr:heavy metal-binding domain-containing protein [Gemmatimonadota bacterium]